MQKQAKRSMGLTKAIILSSAITAGVLMLLLSVIGFAASYVRVKSGITSSAKASLSVYARQIDDWLSEQGKFAEAQANAAGALVTAAGDRSRNDDFLDSVMALNSALLDCYTAYEDTDLYMAVTDVANDLPPDFDATTRSWYQDAVSKRGTVFTAPYIDTATGNMIITVSSPIYENGEITGVFGCDITLGYIMELAGSMKLTENGYPVLIDSSNNFMIHQNPDFTPHVSEGSAVISSVSDAGGEYEAVMAGLLSGDVYFALNRDHDNTEKYFAFAPLDTAHWKIGFVIPKGDVNGTLTDLAVTYAVLLVVFIAVGAFVVIAVTRV